uniref:AlNc14C369G11079 protein n=1 Tax=Albugo laibachii Nc14 TaxID=890382 RepID=F0WY33_9STRA|nr:AlNc14C369G11079 [Albugo laibachii Nc14]|eukprot:CCA26382.1 AlNc14C369G11079 [Albugo laibachii Nc14]
MSPPAKTRAAPSAMYYKKNQLLSEWNRGSVLRSKRSKRSRLVYDFPIYVLRRYFHIPQRHAARELGCSVITLKRNCKRHGIRWPFRNWKAQGGLLDRKRDMICESREADWIDFATRNFEDRRENEKTCVKTEAGIAFYRLPFDCMEENQADF